MATLSDLKTGDRFMSGRLSRDLDRIESTIYKVDSLDSSENPFMLLSEILSGRTHRCFINSKTAAWEAMVFKACPGEPTKTRDELAAAVRHPMQPTYVDEHGTLRFKGNAIVRHLVADKLNELACMNFAREDWFQFYQLIGYSVDGAPIDDIGKQVARAMHNGENETSARIDALETELAMLRKAARDAIAALAELIPEGE